MWRRARTPARLAGAVALTAGLVLVPAGGSHAATPTCDGRPATIVAESNGDVIDGTEGPDVIVGSSGPDVIRGFGGDDVICGLGLGDVIDGGDGSDRMFGGAGNDVVTGGFGNDYVVTGPGWDVADGGLGTIDMGNVGTHTLGPDVVDYRSASGRLLSASLTTGEVLIDGLMTDTDHVSGFEALHGTPFDDSIEGSALPDALHGHGGDDFIDGLAGLDEITGGAGDDTLLADGSFVNETVIGSPVRDKVYGGAGHDELVAALSGSSLFGGPGDDRLESLGGPDRIYGDDYGHDHADGEGDTAVFNTSADMTVDLAAGTATGHGDDSVVDVEHVVTGSGDDDLRGDEWSNDFDTNDGDDFIDGRGRSDFAWAGDGVDTCVDVETRIECEVVS